MALSGLKFTGQNLAVSIAGSLIEQPLVREVRISETKDVHDSTGAGGGNKTYLGGEIGGTCSMTFWDSTKDSDLINKVDLTDDDGMAIIVYPNGNSAGERTLSFSAIPTTRENGFEKNSVVPVTQNFQITGAITRSTV